MHKHWITVIFIAGAIGVAAIILSDHGVISGPAAPPTAPVADMASTDANPMLPNRIKKAADKALPVPVQPSIEDRVAGLFAAIMQELSATNQDNHDTVFTNLFPQLIALDPLAAARLVETTTPESGREELLRQLTQTWVTNDPAAALTWTAQLADTNEQRRAFIYATLQMAEDDPVGAIATANFYRMGDDAVMVDLVRKWAGTDLSAALAWVGDQPAGQQRDEMMARIAFVESHTAPAEAAWLVVENMPPGPAQEEAAMSVLYQWAIRDFPSAKTWVDDFPSGPLRDRALAELSRILAER